MSFCSKITMMIFQMSFCLKQVARCLCVQKLPWWNFTCLSVQKSPRWYLKCFWLKIPKMICQVSFCSKSPRCYFKCLYVTKSPRSIFKVSFCSTINNAQKSPSWYFRCLSVQNSQKSIILSNSRKIYTQDLNSNKSTIFKPDVDVSNPGCLYPRKDL